MAAGPDHTLANDKTKHLSYNGPAIYAQNLHLHRDPAAFFVNEEGSGQKPTNDITKYPGVACMQ